MIWFLMWVPGFFWLYPVLLWTSRNDKDKQDYLLAQTTFHGLWTGLQAWIFMLLWGWLTQ